MALKVLKGRLNPDESPKRYNDILTAARTIESLMDPVLDSYARGTVGISNEEKQVCMDALRSPGGTVLMSCHANADGTYAISVSNEGPVIPASDAERIFDPFVRLSPDEHSLGTVCLWPVALPFQWVTTSSSTRHIPRESVLWCRAFKLAERHFFLKNTRYQINNV